MKISAYILTGDPAWIEQSVQSYYQAVDDIVVSYDRQKLGWTGLPIPVDESIDRLRAIDVDKKMRLVAGDFFDPSQGPIENETRQRQAAIAAAGAGADWVLQFDNDEILPDIKGFIRRLGTEISPAHVAVDWPLRIFFHQTPSGELLEICTANGRFVVESVPIAVRPSIRLHRARRPFEGIFRYRITHLRPLWLSELRQRAPRDSQRLIRPQEAVWHLSWVRSEPEIRRKVANFGHGHDFDGEKYVTSVWKAAPKEWSRLHDFHPLTPAAWPALRPVPFTLPNS